MSARGPPTRRRTTDVVTQRHPTAPTVSAAHGESNAAKSTVASASTAMVTRRAGGPEAEEAPMERRQGVGAGDVPAETHRETAHESEEGPDADAEQRLSTERAQDNHQIDGGGHDVGGETCADLPSEPGSVDPRAETIEPPLVHLAVVHRKLESSESGVRQDRNGTRRKGDDGDGTRCGRDRLDGGRSPATQRPSVTPPRMLPATYHAAVVRKRWPRPTSLRGVIGCQHREPAGRPRRSNSRHQGDDNGGYDDPDGHVTPFFTRPIRRTGHRRR